MSEEEQHVPSQEEEVKTEDPNATINIKVLFLPLNGPHYSATRKRTVPDNNFGLGCKFYWRRSVLQDQTEHQTQQIARRIR